MSEHKCSICGGAIDHGDNSKFGEHFLWSQCVRQLQSTITAQELIIKRLKEDGERLAKRWVEYHNDETISCQYCGLTQSGFKNKHTPGCPITKHTALMSELEKREG